jgi:alpha-amylase
MLSPTSYPTWTGTAQLPAGTVQLKFVKGDDKGNAVWESGANHTLAINGDTSLHVSWQ